jgi:hypothetical protein
VDFEAVKETLHNDHTLTMANGTMKIEKDQRLAEGRWKPIFWVSLIEASSGVSHQSSVLIVNRDYDLSPH